MQWLAQLETLARRVQRLAKRCQQQLSHAERTAGVRQLHGFAVGVSELFPDRDDDLRELGASAAENVDRRRVSLLRGRGDQRRQLREPAARARIRTVDLRADVEIVAQL